MIPLLVRYLSVNIAMANIYLLSYLGGACGEWLSWQIGKDANYYDVRMGDVTVENKFVIVDPLAEWNTTIKSPYDATEVSISDEVRSAIIKKYSEKNFIIPTHFLGKMKSINLPNLKPIRLRFTWKSAPFFYSLLWIKTWTEVKPLDNHLRDFIIKCAEGDSGDPALLKESAVMDRAQLILDRGYYYAFEPSALRMGIRNSTDYIQRFYGFYFRYNLTPLSEYRFVNLENLMFDTKNAVDDWKAAFNMAEPLNVEEIEQYHDNNIKLMETTFNMSYDNWRQEKWIMLLKEWVKFKCPEMYE